MLFVKHIKFWTNSYCGFSVSCAQVIKNTAELPSLKILFLALNQIVTQNENVTETWAIVSLYDRGFQSPCN